MSRFRETGRQKLAERTVFEDFIDKFQRNLPWTRSALNCQYSGPNLLSVPNGVFTRSSKLPANVQQFTCILSTFAVSLLDVCWIV